MWKFGVLVIFMLIVDVVNAQSVIFSTQQQAWITSHPVITYTVSDRWPQDYRDNGKPVGLSRSVLDEITRRTGLKFVYIPPEQALLERPMMIAAISDRLLPAEEKANWLFTDGWANTMPMVVGKSDTPGIRSLNQMRGKRLAIVQNTEYAPWLRAHYPDIALAEYADIRDVLKSVEQGENDAALGSGLVILPILQRFYAGKLAISAQVPDMASGITMAIDPRYPQLRDILNDTLKSINANDAQQIFEDWVGVVKLGTPSLRIILYYYRYQIIAFTLLLFLLLWALRSAHVARRRAQASEKSKSEFLAVMSHEIRTPMNAIVASLELLQQPAADSKKQEYQALALSSSHNLLELLNNVLDHSKLSQQHVPLSTQPCDIAVLLTAVCDSQRMAAERKGVELQLTLGASMDGLWLEADALRLRQIINNLLSNAVKFTDQGSIQLRADWLTEPGLPDALVIAVQDSGIGITPTDQQRLFQAWQQAEAKGAELRGGSGLGLYLCRTLAQQMGGQLTLQSEEGKGSTFTCILPLMLAPASDTSPQDHSLRTLSKGLSVLVVEDHPANQQVLAAQLTQLQCDYEVVESAEQAMQRLEEENYYDAMLLDCNLPGKDGYWLAETIRQFETAQQRDRTPLIAISAVSSLEHRQRCLGCGMDDVLVKPIRLAELARKLGQYSTIAEPQDVLPLSNEVQLWLQQDMDNFREACEASDRRNMVYFIHRINGVAQLYQLDELVKVAVEIEDCLRRQPIQDGATVEGWLEQLAPFNTSWR